MSVKRACKLIEVSPRTLYRYMEEGKIGYRVTPGGRRRFVCHECLLKLPKEWESEQ